MQVRLEPWELENRDELEIYCIHLEWDSEHDLELILDTQPPEN